MYSSHDISFINVIVREPHLKLNIELSFFVRLPVHWHAFILNTFEVAVLHNFTWRQKGV